MLSGDVGIHGGRANSPAILELLSKVPEWADKTAAWASTLLEKDLFSGPLTRDDLVYDVVAEIGIDIQDERIGSVITVGNLVDTVSESSGAS